MTETQLNTQSNKEPWKGIENILTQFLCMGLSPPTTSVDLMELFKGLGSKEQIIQWFREGKIIWVKGVGEMTPNDKYQENMNKCMIKYLSK